MDANTDGGVTSSNPLPSSSLSDVNEDLSPLFVALGTTPFVPSTSTSVVNNNVFFDLYRTGVMPFALSLTEDSDSSPVSFAAVSHLYNTILDSGCTNHIIRDCSLFWTYDVSLAVPVKTANCGVLETLAKGDVKFCIQCGMKSVVFTLHDCLHAPMAPINLLSVGTMQERRMRVHFNEDATVIHFPSNHPTLAGLSFTAAVVRRLSFLHCDFVPPDLPISDGTEVAFPTFPVVEKKPALWHCRFGHLGVDATRALLTKDYVTGIEWSGSLMLSERCISCLIGKHPQLPYSHNGRRTTAVCELLHMGSCGPFPTMTPHKKSLIWAILDDKSNFGHVELLAAKNDVYSAYLKVESLWEAKSRNRIVAVRMDGAKEFSLGKLGNHLTSRGIVMQVTAPYAHSQNGKAERFVRTLEDGFQTLLADSGLPMSFWGDATLTMDYLRNRMPTSVLPSNTTPYEVMNKSKPDLSHLRVWGCQCFVAIPLELRTKGGPRRFEATFVGYEVDRIGWRVRDLHGKYHFSQDIIFNELTPGRLSSLRTNTSLPISSSPSSTTPSSTTHSSLSSSPTPPSPHPVQTIQCTTKGQVFADTIHLCDQRLALKHGGAPHPQQSLSAISDFVSLSIADNILNTEPAVDLASLEQASLNSYCFLTSLDRLRFQRPISFDLCKPLESYHEALACPDSEVWLAAMHRELDSLEAQSAFERTMLPSDRKAIGLRWCYAYKFNPDGTIIVGKEKARLVAQGFSQCPEDYGNTYSPVAKITSICLVLAYAARYDLEIMSFDIKTAFLHAKLSTTIYCKQIPGFPEADPQTILHLLVALYGLRQSSYEFYMLLLRLMVRLGLTHCEVDHVVFSGRWSSPPDASIPMPSDGSDLLLIPVHVDDGLAVTNSIPLYTWFITELCKDIEVVDMGPVSLYLGIRITRDRPNRKLYLSQKAFVTNLLDTWNMTNCHPISMPLRHKLHELPDAPLNSLPDIRDTDIKVNYQRLVGSLIYLAVCT